MRYCLIALIPNIFFHFGSFAQNDEKRFHLGINSSVNYSFSGVSLIAGPQITSGHHSIYAGLKIPLSQTYIALKSPYGWNLGYMHETNRPGKKTEFLFNIDYQIVYAKAYSRYLKSEKRNFIHEFFIGYGIQYKLFKELYIGNIMGIGGYIQSLYNPDINFKKKYYNYNNILKLFIRYKF